MDKSIIGTSKVTRSGQISLSGKVRKEIGVEIGDYVILEKTEDNKLFIFPAEVKIKKKELQRW